MTKDEYIEWKENRVTKEILSIIESAREAHKERLASGTILDSPQQMARTVGNIEAFDFLINIEWEEPAAEALHVV